MTDDTIFKALADDSRRKLLDLLFQEDGQTLSALHSHLLPMSRFGCMKHLQVLEDAGLITSRKAGREKLHYLNPVPIQLVYDRWVSKYAQPFVQALSGLKNMLEDNKAMTQKHTHVYEVFIRTTPELLWQALTDGEITQKYYFGSRVESSWEPGSAYRYASADGGTLLDGEVLEYDPPRKLVTTFRPLFAGEQAATNISKVTYVIEPSGTACKLSITHDDLLADSPETASIKTGWAQIFSSLKSLLETGEAL
jgi:uncharacterized protein YndB with AHSA1/START domain